MTTIYLIRHSEGFQKLQGNILTKDSVQLINEENPLSVDGEILAKNISSNSEFKNIDNLFSSSYVRAMATAKYFAVNNNLKVNIDEKLNFKNLLYNPSSSSRYDTSYLHSLVEISSINQGEKYSVETGKYFSIVTCGDMYDVYSEQYIVDKNINSYASVCK